MIVSWWGSDSQKKISSSTKNKDVLRGLRGEKLAFLGREYRPCICGQDIGRRLKRASFFMQTGRRADHAARSLGGRQKI